MFGVATQNGVGVGIGNIPSLTTLPYATQLYLAILGLFSSGANGAFLDANDWGPTGTGGTGVCFQDLSGTAVTAMEQPVQLILDKSQGLKLGSELVVNGSNLVNTTGWTASGTATLSADTGRLKVIGGYAYQAFTTVVGKVYALSMDFTLNNAGGFYIGTSVGGNQIYSSGAVTSSKTLTAKFVATTTTTYISLWAWNSGTEFCFYNNITCKNIAGNHAYVSASANRPIITARYNLRTKTEDKTHSDWTKTNCTAVDATTIKATAGTTPSFASEVATVTASPYVMATNANKGTYSYLWMGDRGDPIIHSASFNLATGAVIGSSNCTPSISLNADGTYRCTITYTRSTAGTASQVEAFGDSVHTIDYPTKTWSGTETLIVTKDDYRPSDQATGLIPTYQRVNTSTDYDTVGFPVREAYNGSNQLLGGASGGGATTGFFFCAGVMITKVGAAQTLFSDTGTNTGWRVRINASNQLELSAGNGSAYTTIATAGTVSINKLTVITAWHDGTNLNVQINQGAVAQAAFAVATAGTAGYTLGCDNGASTNYLQGSLGEIVYRTGTAMTAAQISSAQAFVNSKQKAY